MSDDAELRAGFDVELTPGLAMFEPGSPNIQNYGLFMTPMCNVTKSSPCRIKNQ